MGSWGHSESTHVLARLRVVYVLVALVAAAHAGLYVFAVPPWALEDEEQHVDYVLSLRDNGKPPHLDDYIDQDIVDSAVATNRWGSLGLGQRPTTPTGRLDPAQMGLEGYSYEAYQPPLYYTALVPVAVVAGDRLMVFLYAARLVGALILAATAVLAAWLGARWAAPGRAMIAAWVGGLACALLPANAESAARVNNDFACALLVTAGIVGLTKLLDQPDSRWSLWTGLAFAGAIFTKPGGVIGIGVGIVGLVLLARRRQLTAPTAAALLGPQILALASWSLVSHTRYGEWNAATAVVDRRVRFPPMGWGDLASQALERAATPYGTWDVSTALTVGWLVFVVLGGALLGRSPRRADAIPLTLTVVASSLVGVATLNESGLLNAFTARYVVFAFPVVLAATAAGWSHLPRPNITLAPLALAAAAAAIFFTTDFLPQFPFRLG